MNRKLLVLAVIGALTLGGCATSYDNYLDQVSKINAAQAQNEQVRDAARQMDINTIAKLAEGGSDTARIVAALAISQTNMVADLARANGGGGSKAIVPVAPKDPMESFVALLGIAVPAATNVYAITKNTQAQVDIARINATIEQSRNQTFASIATAGINGVASVNVQPNVTTTVTAGGDAINGNQNSTTRRTCQGGNATATGTAGNAAAGGAGGNGTTTGGTGGAGAPGGSTNPTPTAGGANC